MTKFKVLKNNVFEGYKEGDIIEREFHAMEYHLIDGDVQQIFENPVKNIVEGMKAKKATKKATKKTKAKK